MAGKWKRRRWMRGDGKKKLLVSVLSAAVLVLAVFGAGKTGLPSAAAVQEERAASGANAYSVLSACAALWFPPWIDSFDDREEKAYQDRADGLTYFLADRLTEGIFWYRAAEGGEETSWTKPDPAYAHYKKKQEQAKEYSRLADALWASQVLSDSGLLAGADGTVWSQALPGKGDFDMGNGLEQEKQKEQTATAENAGLLALPPSLSIGTTAGVNLLERAGLPVTGKTYLAEQLADYDYVMKHFYTVHPTAAAGRDMIQAETFLAKDFSLKREADSGKPQILIYHSHSQEEFADYHMGNKEATIVGAGGYLAQLLEEKGYQVLHDTSVYDLRDGKLDRNKAYSYALEGVEKILKENPSIQVVLDLHRDGVDSKTRLVQEVNGKPTAQIMFFNGTSQTPDGPISYLENPNREDNLAFSFQMKLCADAFYPGYARNIYLKGLRYNLHLRPRSVLVEAGAQTNTYEEARNAMEPLAELLDTVLGGGA